MTAAESVAASEGFAGLDKKDRSVDERDTVAVHPCCRSKPGHLRDVFFEEFDGFGQMLGVYQVGDVPDQLRALSTFSTGVSAE